MRLSFMHGLGDAVQFAIVLRAIQGQQKHEGVVIRCLPGKDSVFRHIPGVTVESCSNTRDRMSATRDIHWREPDDVYPSFPSTKPARCLIEEFGLPLEGVDFHYHIPENEADREKAAEYVASLPSKPVAIHYQANTRAGAKNLPHDLVKSMCDSLIEGGLTPLILDWDHRCPFVDNERIFCADAEHPLWGGLGTGDASIIRYLIEGCVAMLGVDSGPLHVAGATGTPTIGIWRCLHPLQFYDLAENVLHLVPKDHATLIRTPDEERRAQGLEYFKQAYRSREYEDLGRDLQHALWSVILRRLLDETPAELDDTAVGKVYCQYNRSRGFDPFFKGAWQSRYAEMIERAFGLRGRKVLDLGCAAGALASAFADRGADMAGIDICRYFIEESPFENLRGRLQAAPAWDLPFADKAFDLVHCSQVLEHVPEERQKEVFRELRRVLRPDGVLFAAMPMGSEGADPWDDVTHSCLRDFTFWRDLAEEAGFGHTAARWTSLDDHPMYREYEWSYLVATGMRERKIRVPTHQAANGGRWIIAYWGDNKRHIFEPVVRALEAHGHACRWIRRDDSNARPELIEAISNGGYDHLLTWQRFYPMQRDVLNALKNKTLQTVFMDYGFLPHYESVVFDPDGENATSALAARWAMEDRESPSPEALRRVDDVLRQHALRALEVRGHPPAEVMRIERPFVFVPLQRPIDSVIRFDSDIHDFGVLVRRVLSLAAHRFFVVIKPHPMDRDLDLGIPDFAAGRHVVLRKPFHGDNEVLNDWLLSQAALVIGVNSNMLFRAILFGKPVIACGRGWFTGSAAISDASADPNLLSLRVAHHEPRREREYVATCLDRQLTFKELEDASKVIRVLRHIGALSAHAIKESAA